MNINIFSDKEMFLMEHDSQGNLYSQKGLSRHYKKIHNMNNLHLLDGVELSAYYQFPKLSAYTGPYDWDTFVPFSRRKNATKKAAVVHCFEQDFGFESLWASMDKAICSLFGFDAAFTPDNTLFVDAPDPVNKWQLYKSRLCGARMQKAGINTIPTVTYADATSLNWCLDGLPKRSVLGISGTGLKQCSARLKLFQYALRRVEEELEPIVVFVYGDSVEVPGLKTELRFIPTYISKHFRQ